MGGGAAALVVILTTYAAEITEGKSVTAKPLLAGGLLGLMLSIVGGVSPRVGNAFAILVVVAAVLTNGNGAVKALGIARDAAGTPGSANGTAWTGAMAGAAPGIPASGGGVARVAPLSGVESGTPYSRSQANGGNPGTA